MQLQRGLRRVRALPLLRRPGLCSQRSASWQHQAVSGGSTIAQGFEGLALNVSQDAVEASWERLDAASWPTAQPGCHAQGSAAPRQPLPARVP